MTTESANIHFFTNFSQLPLSDILFTVLFVDVGFLVLPVLVLGNCVEVDLDRITILLPPLPRLYVLSLPTVLSLIQVIVI